MSERKGFRAGVEAMRELLAKEFEQIGSGGFNGYEIANLIRQVPGPRPDEKPEPAEAPQA